MLQALCWVRQWKRREWLEGTAGQPSLSGFYISAGISSVFQSSQLGVCLSVSPIDPPCLSCLAYVKECWTFYQKEFTNVLCFKLLIYTADFLGLSFPISQRRGWPHEMKRLPPLWYLVIFRNEETTLGFFMELSWRGSCWEVKACSSHPAPFCTPSAKGGTRTNTFVYKFPDSSFFRLFELSFAVRVTLLWGGTDIQMLEGCWAGGLGIRVSHCRGRGRWCVSGSHWDHLLMDVCQLAQTFLWYYYFRDKKRPAG